MKLAIETGEDLSAAISPLLAEGRAIPALEFLRLQLAQVRAHATPSAWADYCSLTFSTQKSPRDAISTLLQAGPLGSGASGAARGLIHEPLVLDVIYNQDQRPSSGETYAALTDWELDLGFCQSLRSRLAIFSRELTELANSPGTPRILAVGCGHLREAAKALLSPNAKNMEVIALDRDRACLDFLERQYTRPQVTTVSGSWRELQNRDSFGLFDFIYVPTLFDKMDDRQATLLLSTAVALLKPGGRLLAANFTPDLADAAYLEACLDWWPCYRSEEDLAALLTAETSSKLRGQAVFRDETGGTAFLDLQVL